MAQISYRANLSAATFPLSLSKAGRSVIIPGPDQNFDRRIDAAGDTQQGSVGIPQVLYMEDVLPTSEGYQTVGFDTTKAAAGLGNFSYMIPVPTSVVRVTGEALGKLYIAFAAAGIAKKSISLDTWQDINVALPGGWMEPSFELSSFAVVGKRNFLCTHRYKTPVDTKIYEIIVGSFNVGTGSIDVTITDITATIAATLPGGLFISQILSICGSYNYLILATVNTILWSSTTTPTDFAPSLVSGAGNEIPNNLQGAIRFIRSHLTGFYIYTSQNALVAKYTGNQRYPWKFTEIQNSGGYSSPTQSAGNTNDINHYGIDEAKNFQVIAESSASNFFPEISDFLRSDYYSLFNPISNTFIKRTMLGAGVTPVNWQIWHVLDRYIIIPYGYDDLFQWNRSIVYDKTLKRVGIITAQYNYIIDNGVKVYFITSAGLQITALEFQHQIAGKINYLSSGLIILGKFQYIRNKYISVDEIEVESTQYKLLPYVGTSPKDFTCAILPTLDGKTFLPAVIPYDASPIAVTSEVSKYLSHVSCHNFALVFRGYFSMNTLQIKFHVEGDK